MSERDSNPRDSETGVERTLGSSDYSQKADQSEPEARVYYTGPELPAEGQLSAHEAQLTISSGPLPSPEVLARYGQIDASYPERIFRMAEAESEHRRGQERDALSAEIEDARAFRRERRRGQTLGFVLSLLFLSVGTGVTLAGHPTVGGVIVGTTLVSLVVVFVTGRGLRGAGQGEAGDAATEDR